MKNGNFKSLSKDQAKRCISFFLKESFNYKNFDEHGRYIPRSKRNNNKRIFNNKNLHIEQNKTLEPKYEQVAENKNPKSTINESVSPIIKTSDEQTLNMILKITFTILDFIKDIVDDSNKYE